MKESEESHNIYKIALLVAISCVLQICESLIPHPIPGLRLGLANVITLIALVTMGFGYALEITILRTILSSFIMGTFMSPTFILSFLGGFISTLTMGFLYWLSCFHRHYRLSMVGISIVGALTHNIVQLYLAYLLLVKHTGIFIFFPWLCIGGVVMGWVTGAAAGRVCHNLRDMNDQGVAVERFERDYSGLMLDYYLPGSSFIHRLSPEIKIVSIFILSLAVLIFNNPWFYAGLFLFLAAMAVISRTSFTFLLLKAQRYASLIFASFLFPVFFNSGSHVLSSVAYFKITAEGLSTGVLFALRILFLIMASSLLARTTSPEEMTRGLTRALLPLRPLGISEKRIAAILSLSWLAIPVFWEMSKNIIRRTDLKEVKNLSSLISLLSNIITALYLQTEQVTTVWEDVYFVQNRDSTFIKKEVDGYREKVP